MSELPADANIVCVGPLDDKRFDELPCNLINIDDASLDVPEVFNILQDIFEKYAAWNRQMIEAVLENEPLQKIFDIGATALENPIALFDASLALIMTAGKLPENYQGTIWEDVIKFGYSPVENLPFQERKRMSEWVLTKKEPFFYKSDPSTDISDDGRSRINGRHFGTFGLIDINRFTWPAIPCLSPEKRDGAGHLQKPGAHRYNGRTPLLHREVDQRLRSGKEGGRVSLKKEKMEHRRRFLHP